MFQDTNPRCNTNQDIISGGKFTKPSQVNPPPVEEGLIGQEPDRANFVEWLLGAVGIGQQEKPDPVVTIPGTCPPCSE